VILNRFLELTFDLLEGSYLPAAENFSQMREKVSSISSAEMARKFCTPFA